MRQLYGHKDDQSRPSEMSTRDTFNRDSKSKRTKSFVDFNRNSENKPHIPKLIETPIEIKLKNLKIDQKKEEVKQPEISESSDDTFDENEYETEDEEEISDHFDAEEPLSPDNIIKSGKKKGHDDSWET